jgi:hypothetical protein
MLSDRVYRRRRLDASFGDEVRHPPDSSEACCGSAGTTVNKIEGSSAAES